MLMILIPILNKIGHNSSPNLMDNKIGNFRKVTKMKAMIDSLNQKDKSKQIISLFIDDLFSNIISHHLLLGIMILFLSLYSCVKSLKFLNKHLDSNN